MRPSGNGPWVRRRLVALAATLALGLIAHRAEAAGCHLGETPTFGLHDAEAGDPLAILNGPAEPRGETPPALRSAPCSPQNPANDLGAPTSFLPALVVDPTSPVCPPTGRVILPRPRLASRLAPARLDRPPRPDAAA